MQEQIGARVRLDRLIAEATIRFKKTVRTGIARVDHAVDSAKTGYARQGIDHRIDCSRAAGRERSRVT
ncbi:hypothetical protein GCM10007067_08250 [Lysobacter bugurensis]|uniref:Uncharacterized protein n=1 Tax=Cognatilysobacter bugurensis TaxID=543356 RepID=A0A918W7F1_9GAMM|nr:hypothetical protein GCM10007067_08250 [Lysobacter bugurensis]